MGVKYRVTKYPAVQRSMRQFGQVLGIQFLIGRKAIMGELLQTNHGNKPKSLNCLVIIKMFFPHRTYESIGINYLEMYNNICNDYLPSNKTCSFSTHYKCAFTALNGCCKFLSSHQGHTRAPHKRQTWALSCCSQS